MRKLVCILYLFFAGVSVYGSDSLRISFTTKTFVKGDTLEFKCTVPNFAELKLQSATLNVWIEDVEKKHRWKYRYPMINGEVSASLTVSDKIPDGRYAVNFMVQRGFFKVYGEVLDHEKKDTSIIYIMIPKNKSGSYFDNAHVAPDGSFRLKSTLFADSAFFIFAPSRKVKTNYLSIHIETPLDSAFSPVLYETHFITVGAPAMLLNKKNDTSHYAFQSADLLGITLPNVTVTTKAKTKMQQYDEEYASGLFHRDDAILFDGLGSDEISRSINVLMYLQGRVPGLTIEKNESGQDIAKWRNEIVDIFIDEFRLDPSDASLVATSEIAMIKVFRPPAQLSGLSGNAGAIAIYTKKGAFMGDNKAKHNFIVKGYTKIESVWE